MGSAQTLQAEYEQPFKDFCFPKEQSNRIVAGGRWTIPLIETPVSVRMVRTTLCGNNYFHLVGCFLPSTSA